MQGVDVVFHISPHEADEVELTRTVIDACEREGARLVFAGVHVTAATPWLGWFVRRFYGMVLPATAGSSPSAGWSSARPRTRSSSCRATSCRTTRCCSTSSAPASSCTRAAPRGSTGSTCSTSARWRRTSCSTPAAVGQLRRRGPASLTGPECARVWSEALGVPVRYAGDDDEALEAALTEHLTGLPARRLALVAAHAARLRGARLPGGAGPDRAAARAPTTDFRDFVPRVLAEQSDRCPGGCPGHHLSTQLSRRRGSARYTSPATARPSS